MLIQPALVSQSNLQGITTITARMGWYCALTNHLLDQNTSDHVIQEQLRGKIIDLYKSILIYQMRSICAFYRLKGLNFVRAVVNWDDWNGALNQVKDAEAVVQQDFRTYMTLQSQSTMSALAQGAEHMQSQLSGLSNDMKHMLIEQRQMRLDDADRQCIWSLRVVDPTHELKTIAKKKDTLLPEAYRWFLSTDEYKSFMSPKDTNTSEGRLLHIQGHAGTGKTMLLMGIIQELEEDHSWGHHTPSYFFFQSTESTLNNATSAMRSLIWMLLTDQPQLVKHLRKKYNASGPDLFHDRNAFFALSSIFRDMLHDPELPTVLFLVDALDECESLESERATFLELILESLRINSTVKWIITSRPEVSIQNPPIRTNWNVSSFGLDSISLEGPVNAYINHKLPELKRLPGYDDQVMESLILEIRDRAAATFLWVSLALKELEHVDGWDALDTLKSLPKGLTGLYDAIITKIETRQEQHAVRCKTILSATCLAFRPLSLCELAVVTGLQYASISVMVQRCGSFLIIKDDTVSLIHQSAKDYLVSVYQSRIQPFGFAHGHGQLVNCSIAAMSKVLKRNIYNLKTFDSKPREARRGTQDPLATVRYSCLFWMQHAVSFLESEGSEDHIKQALGHTMLAFLRRLFLQWLESVSLIGRISRAAELLSALLDLAETNTEHKDLAEYLRDAEMLAHRFGLAIDKAPLQAYASALLFSPQHNKVRVSQWGDRLPFIQDSITSYEAWNVRRHCLRGHEVHTTSVSFTPDGTKLVSGDSWGNVRVWDPVTGVCWQQIKVEGSIVCFSFSKCGQWMVTGSQTGRVYLYNANTGDVVAQLQGDTKEIYGQVESIQHVSISPDSSKVYAVARKFMHPITDTHYLCVWDVSTGQLLKRHTMKDKSQHSLPNDASQVVFTDWDTNSIKLQCLSSWTVTTKLRDWPVRQMTMSDDQTLLAVLCAETIRLYDLQNGQIIRESAYSDGDMTVMRFSPDAQLLVGITSDRAIIWDVATLSVYQVLLGIHSMIPAMPAISPDNKTLALTVYHDVYLYEILGGEYVASSWRLNTHVKHAGAITFSPCRQLIAYFGGDQIVRLQDRCQGNRVIHSQDQKELKTVLFSDDGTCLAVMYTDCVEVYNVLSGQFQQAAKDLDDLIWPNGDARTFDSAQHRTVSHFDKLLGVQGKSVMVDYPAKNPLSYSLFQDRLKNWMQYNGNGLFWIPAGRSVFELTLNGNDLALLHSDSTVTCIQLDESKMSLQ